mgnify:CR=1 FL=1
MIIIPSNVNVAVPIVATGGTVTDITGFRVHSFTSSGSLSITAGLGSILEYLVVGGGGAGGTGTGGGGGAGGLFSGSFALPSIGSWIVSIGGISTGSGNPTKFFRAGYGSLLSTSYGVYLPSSSAFTMGTGDFTIECWYYSTAFDGNNYLYDLGYNGSPCSFYQNKIYWYVGSDSMSAASGVGFSTQTWHHMALTRSGTTVSGYIDGTRVATMTSSANMTNTNCMVGGYGGTGYSFYGNISNFRIVKGAAMYTGSSFTVPTSPLTAVAGTSCLVCQGDLTDRSPNAFTATVTSDATVSTLSPFSDSYGFFAAGGGQGGGSNGTAGSGGSGGGGNPGGSAGKGNTPSTTPSQGYDGAAGGSLSSGGGGAGHAGYAQVSTTTGAGGDGVSSSITGTALYYAGGGSGGAQANARSGGGSGVGGAGASGKGWGWQPATTPTANTGSGGGGAGVDYGPSSGAAGIVIVRYAHS